MCHYICGVNDQIQNVSVFFKFNFYFRLDYGVSQVTLVVKKEPTSQYRRLKTLGFDPWVRKIPWRRKQQPTPVLLPGKSQGQRSLAC